MGHIVAVCEVHTPIQVDHGRSDGHSQTLGAQPPPFIDMGTQPKLMPTFSMVTTGWAAGASALAWEAILSLCEGWVAKIC
jgi:hypothetical protein